jgi:protein ImuB
MFACLHSPAAGPLRLAECAAAFTPRYEATAPDAVLLDLAGLDRLLGPPHEVAAALAAHLHRLDLEASIAIASNPDAAFHAARGLPGVTVIPPGEEARVLAHLPLELLPLSPEIQETFSLWGLHRFADLAALPPAGLSERLGPAGLRLQQLARGSGDRPLAPSLAPPAFEEFLDLEHPIVLLEPLGFLLARLLVDLCARLETWGLATCELRLHLALEDHTTHLRTLRLPLPTRNHRACWKLLHLDLESHPPQAPIVAVRLTAEPARPRATQHGLFLPPTPEPEKLELTLARLAHLVGPENIGAASLLDTHRPDAFRIERFVVAPARRAATLPRHTPLALRVFRPPLRATVQLAGERPIRVVARGVQGQVVSRAGPWRASGDWWATHSWSRDEWDVALTDGALYRLFWDRRRGAWFLEGSYD